MAAVVEIVSDALRTGTPSAVTRPAAMYAQAGLDSKGIVTKAFEALGQNLRGETVKLGRA